ncbi:glutathione ABC transporter substrate-binding protein [Paenibacillus senegalensis]|uniref:glutathione ABC transporter substrate-binding protein n=1 Tax=Paenibacillus senegalensis TaxID=1465766 RepID=UPI000289FB44|nr:glutathione ABC transporter substrate-binding protein [Paenibacillus senegalensis]
MEASKFLGKRKTWLLSIFFLLAIFFTACSSNEAPPSESPSSTPSESSPPESGPNEAGSGGDLIVAWLSDPPSMDPHMSTDQQTSVMTTHLYDTLVKHDKDLNIVPSLAESWRQVDELTWEFKLREGVTFTDGSAFNADVVKANLDRMLDPKVASPRASLVNMVEEVIVVDENTVQIVTQYPFSPFLSHLAHPGVGIISAEAIEKDNERVAAGEKAGAYLAQNPAGSGVFKLENWIPGQEVRLVANENYWGSPAKIDGVTFKVVSETGTRVAELETGYAHIIDPVSPSDVNRINNFPDASVNKQPSLSLSYVGFNMQKEPFTDIRVRQALSMAINKHDILDGIYEGIGLPAEGPLAPSVFGYDSSVTPIEYNVERAKQLLAEAGYPNGFSTTLWTNDNAERIKIGEYVQSKLKEINVEVKLETLEWGAYLSQTAAGNHDMFILGWSAVTADADYALYPVFHSSNVGEPGNRTFTQDADLDRILEDARKETDESKRKALYKEAQERLVEIAPMLYIHHIDYLDGVSDLVEGFWKHPNGIMQLHDVSLKQ